MTETMVETTPGAGLALRPLEGEIVEAPLSLPGVDEFERIKTWASVIANSGMVPMHLAGKANAVATVVLYARELRIPPITALTSIFVIDAKPSMGANLMRGLINRAGHLIWLVHSDNERAEWACRRMQANGEYGDEHRMAWTIDDAKKATLLNKTNWKNYPAAMLRARATSAIANAYFPDILLGIVYTPEELGAQVDSAGNVTALPASKVEGEKGGDVDRTAAIAAARAEHEAAAEPAPVEQPARVMHAPAEDEPVPVADPDAPAELPTEEQLAEVSEPAEPEQADVTREDVWAELVTQARLMDNTVAQWGRRWAALHRKNVDQATTDELADFVAEKRDLVSQALIDHPEIAERQYHGEEPVCPPEPEQDAA